ncbi:putative reverse transcriptase domain-containing protein [Tanacetum coccineum]
MPELTIHGGTMAASLSKALYIVLKEFCASSSKRLVRQRQGELRSSLERFTAGSSRVRVSVCDLVRNRSSQVLIRSCFIECVGPVAYRLKLPQELSCVHDTFHVSNLKKCLAEPDVQVPLDEIEIDENLRFVEEPIEIVERDVKKLKRRRIPLVKVRWNSRQGAEYTWEREDQFRKKYPNLFSEPVPSSGVAT